MRKNFVFCMIVELFIDQKCYESSSWHDMEVEAQLLVKVALFVIDLSIYLSIFSLHTHDLCWKLHSCDDLSSFLLTHLAWVFYKGETIISEDPLILRISQDR